jgi:GxxExxY protein
MADLIYQDECYQIMGACFEVYKEKGCGFLESVYQECLEIELKAREIFFAAKQVIRLTYKEQHLTQTFAADFICLDKIVLEIKAVSSICDEHRAQVLNYLAATGFKLGLLVNFGHFPRLEWERIVRSPKKEDFSL